jgi:hypothetical protein
MESLRRPITLAATLDKVPRSGDHYRAFADNLKRRLEEQPQPTTLVDLNDQLWKIDDNLSHIKNNTSERIS